jgi:glycosyltransferase involved in cell wall biosynthesis
MPRLSIVIPIFNEEENLPELGRRLRAACDGLGEIEWQTIYVNDGSSDRSVSIMLDQHAADPRFTLVDLSRNFGHQAAISAGLAHADGDAVVIMDGDLQDPPEVIPDLIAAWRSGAKVVRAERRSRQDTGLRAVGFRVFHRLFALLSDMPIASHTGVFSLLDRQAVREFNQLRENNRFIPGLRDWLGFEQATVVYDRSSRAAGEPKQTLRRLVRYAMDAVFSFSYKPLRLMTWFGVCVSGVGFLLASFYIARRLLGIEEAQMGFTTIVSLVLFLGGIQLIGIGLLGEYLGRTYDEVKRRPLYIVKSRYGIDPLGE